MTRDTPEPRERREESPKQQQSNDTQSEPATSRAACAAHARTMRHPRCPARVPALEWDKASRHRGLRTTGRPSYPLRADLQRSQGSQEFVRERGDRAQKAIGLYSAGEQRYEDHSPDDPGDRPWLDGPTLDPASEESEHRAELADDEEKRGEHERGSCQGCELVGDELHEEAPGESEQGRGPDHREAPHHEGATRGAFAAVGRSGALR